MSPAQDGQTVSKRLYLFGGSSPHVCQLWCALAAANKVSIRTLGGEREGRKCTEA